MPDVGHAHQDVTCYKLLGMSGELELGRAFWVLVGVGIVAGIVVADRVAKTWGLKTDVIHSLVPWALIPGFFSAHFVALGLYHPEAVREDPWILLRFWVHISSIGGMLGGALGVWVYLRRTSTAIWDYIDAIAVGFTVAWIFGRVGCTLAFDHPGTETDFFLAMVSPEGRFFPPAPRHNLGLYEVFWSVGLAAFFATQLKKSHPRGWYVAVFGLAYCPYRFALDFLRIADETYGGLTPAQFLMMPVFGLCVWFFVKKRDT